MRKSLFLVAAFAIAAGLFTTSVIAKETKPGVERWPIKTSVVENSPRKTVPLATLLALVDVPGVSKNDPRYQSARIAGFDNPTRLEEGEMVTSSGWLHLVAGETDGDYHIQISASKESGDHCLIVEVPKDDADYVSSSALRKQVGATRAWIRAKLLKGHEPSSTGSVMTHPVYVTVTGQLFYDDAHVGDQPRGKKGMKAATLWELHPVTTIEFAKAP